MGVEAISVQNEKVQVIKKQYTIKLDEETLAHVIAALGSEYANADEECFEEDAEDYVPNSMKTTDFRFKNLKDIQNDLIDIVKRGQE